jgi:formylglycine-generating enzyme
MKTTNLLALPLALLVFGSNADPACSDTFGSGDNTFDIELVTIGNPGNAADATGDPNPAGSVAETYRIGKFEISEQMIAKANILGGLGITKDIRDVNMPATSVSWNEAARFVNWLNTSSGNTPAYKFALQPGDIGYNPNASIQLWTTGDSGYDSSNRFRNSLAHYFLPSAHEWYKAAYYDPSSGLYYDYPTGSDSAPDGIDFVGDPYFAAVFFDSDSNPQPNDIFNVGLLSPYGTAGQGGNVWEWEETDFDLVNDSSTIGRGNRGGGWSSSSGLLASSYRAVYNSNSAVINVGFRIASIHEAATLQGDFNSDGSVDAADYVVWRKNNGSPEDYNEWRTNFGSASGSGGAFAAAVPEPAACSVLCLAAVFSLSRRRPSLRVPACTGAVLMSSGARA